MSLQPSFFTELPREKKILLAGGNLRAAGDIESSSAPGGKRESETPRLNSHDPSGYDAIDVLIALAGDPELEVSSLAERSLSSIDNDRCARRLAEASLPEFVARYFLDPQHARPALLPLLLASPASPQDAITRLAAQAGPESLDVILQHLDLLKTPALAALKKNPAAPERGKRTPAAIPSSREEKLAAARDAMSIPAEQRLEVLVALASDRDAEVSAAAGEALQSLPEEECLESLTAPSMPDAVARYFLDPLHVRPALLAMILVHPEVNQDAVAALAGSAGPEVLGALLEQLDLLKTPALIALKNNPAYLDWQKAPSKAGGIVLEIDLLEMLIQEVEAENVQAKNVPAENLQLEATQSDSAAEEPAAETVGEQKAEEKAEGVLSKIARMSVAKKVVLALRGNKEERAILIRDGSKVVSRAVLGSPKLTDGEVESFAAQKNVSQEVLRLIATNRKFIKDYIVLKNLGNNPRLPIDLGLALINRLLPNDVRGLAANRDVSDTVRKMAHRAASSKTH